MRRTLLLIVVILILAPGAIKARHRGFHYSPYAFSHKHPSGLVPNYVRYCPYAFSHKHPSGLIDMYCGNLYHFSPVKGCSPVVVYYQLPNRSGVKRIKNPVKPRERDGIWIVYDYLKSKGLDVGIVDIFVVKNKTASAVLLVRNKNLFVLYQNSEAEKLLAKNSVWAERYKQYQEKQKERVKEYEAAGWKIGQIDL